MKIAVLGLDRKRKTGLETWKDNLIFAVSKGNDVREIYTKSLWNVFKNVSFVVDSEVCHSYSQSLGTIVLMALRKLFGKKNIHTVHGDYFMENNSKSGLKKILWIPFNDACIYLADKVTFPSSYLMNRIVSQKQGIKSKCLVIPNAIDVRKVSLVKKYSKQKLGLAKDNFLIVEVTNFNLIEKARGIDVLVKDFETFHKKNKKSILYVLGGGKNLDKYKSKYQSDKIVFLGFREDAKSIISACDLFVHYSFLDSFGLVLVEAMALDKPVIAKGSLSFTEILGSQLSLSDLNKGDLVKLRSLSKKLVKNYDLSHFGIRMLEVYRE